MARSLTTQDVSWFLDLNSNNQLNLDPPYQRRSVWTLRDKRFFIDTILNDFPAPPVFLHKQLDEYGRSTYHVVDGKQRLKTIIDFTNNKFRTPDEIADTTLQKKRWRDLDSDVRKRFWNYVLIVEMLPDVSAANIRDTFERINRNSRKLTPQEMRHAKYEGWFITTVENEADKAEWRDFGIVTAARSKRMLDVQFISELFALIIDKAPAGFDQNELDEMYAEYEEIDETSTLVPDDVLAEVERIKRIVQQAIERAPALREYLKIQSHFYTFWGYLAVAGGVNIDELAPKYAAFLAEASARSKSAIIPEAAGLEQSVYIQAVLDYATNMRGANTELPQRAKRQSAVIAAMGTPGVAGDEDR